MARNPRIGRPGGGRRLTSLAAAVVIARGGIVTPTPTPTPGGLVAFAYQPETQSYMTATSAAGAPLRDALARRLDYAIRRSKASGGWATRSALWMLSADSEAQARINLKNPGTYNLTAVGTPTFAANDGVTTTANTSYYETNHPLSAVARDNHAMEVYSLTAVGGTLLDMGARDSAGVGITINGKSSTAQAVMQSFTAPASINPGVTAHWNGSGWAGVYRNSGAAVDAAHHGVTVASAIASTSVALQAGDTTTIRILGAAGSTATTTRKLGAASIGAYLTPAQRLEDSAAWTDYIECVRFGAPYIEEVGKGQSSLSYDFVGVGCSLATVMAAYDARRRGLSACIIGDWRDETIWDLGATPGLTFIDAKVPTHLQGLLRDGFTWMNTVSLGRSDASTQDGLSVTPRDYQRMIRRMLDPTRTAAATGSSLIPGMDVPVFMTGGVVAVTKVARKITRLLTADGRVVTGKVVFEGTYDGDLIRLGGIPYQLGHEAAGIGNESSGGYRDNTRNLKPQTGAGGIQLDVDARVIPGDDSSGLIYGVIPDPAIASGAADPLGLQPLNKRLTWTNSMARMYPLAIQGQPPAGYEARKYEMFRRIFLASAAAGVTYTLAMLLKIDATANTFDVNNGEGRISTDKPNSGIDYALAGENIAARKAVFDDVQSWISGLMYWLLCSGDASIPPAMITALQGYYMDPLSHLDPGTSGVPLFYPRNAYRREPIYLMKNAGYRFDANDADGVNRADGSVPRSIKTASTASYALDLHSKRIMSVGGFIAIQGALYNASAQYAGGNNGITPMPLEMMVPDADVCSNMIVGVAYSCSRLEYGSVRMEPTMGMGGQFAGAVAKYAIDNNVAVQDVDYDAVRTMALNAGDATPLTLRQLN